jgi:hypothetical protein
LTSGTLKLIVISSGEEEDQRFEELWGKIVAGVLELSNDAAAKKIGLGNVE